MRTAPLIIAVILVCGLAASAAGKGPRLCRDDEPIVGLTYCAAESEIANWPMDWRAEAHAGRAHSYAHELRRFDKAMAEYDRAIALAPSDPEIRVGRGVLRVRLQQYSDAVADFTTALKLEDSASARHCRAYALRQLGKQAEAEADERLLPPSMFLGIQHHPCPPRF